MNLQPILTFDVLLDSIEERNGEVFASLSVFGGSISLPLVRSQLEELRTKIGTVQRVRVVYKVSAGRSEFLNPQFETIEPSRMQKTGLLSANVEASLETYEREGEIFRKISLTSVGFGVEYRATDELVQMFGNLKDPKNARLTARFAWDTRWKNGRDGKYQTLKPIFDEIQLVDGADNEKPRRERERPQT